MQHLSSSAVFSAAEMAGSGQVFPLNPVTSWPERKTLHCWGVETLSLFHTPCISHLELTIFQPLPPHPSAVMTNKAVSSPVNILPWHPHCASVAMLTVFSRMPPNLSNQLFSCFHESLLAQLPSSPLAAHSLPEKPWLSQYYWVTLGLHCLPWAPGKRSPQPPSQVLIWCNGPLIAF